MITPDTKKDCGINYNLNTDDCVRVSHTEIRETFGIRFKDLMKDEKIYIYHCYMDVLELGNKEQSNSELSSEVHSNLSNSDKDFTNVDLAITKKKKGFTTAVFKRTYLGDEHLFSCDMQFLRTPSKPIGVKITTYNLANISKEGVFLTLNPRMYEIPTEVSSPTTSQMYTPNEEKKSNMIDLI